MTTVLYDEDCGFCRWSADKLRVWDTRRQLSFAPIQSERGAELLHAVPVGERLDSMHAVTLDGRVWSGGQAVRAIVAEFGSTLQVAFAEPLNPEAIDQVAFSTGKEIQVVVGALVRARWCGRDSRTPGRRVAGYEVRN